jgi:hypothetical protein
MALLHLELPWDSQPQEPVELAAWLPAGTIVYVPSTGQILGGPQEEVSLVKTPVAGGLSASASTTTSRANAGIVGQAQAGAFTVVSVVRRTAGTAVQYIGATVSTGTSYLEYFAINANASSTVQSGSINLRIRVDASNIMSVATNAATLEVNGVPAVVAVRFLTSTTADIWVNGFSQSVTYSNTGAASPANQAVEFPVDILNRNVRGVHGDGATQAQILLYARIPTCAVDMLALSTAPWESLLEPQRIPIPVSVVAGGAFNAAWAVRNSRTIGAGVI